MANLNLGKTKIISDKNNTFFTNNKIMTGTKIPTSGDYVKGDMIVNIGSTSASEPIWICNVSGNPGQWSVLGIGTVGGGSSTTIVSADVVCIQDIITVDNAVSEVSLEGLGVNISTDDKLMVHFNSVYLMEGIDYNIDYTNNKITVIGDEPWNNSGIEGSVFSLELFRNVQDTEGSVIQARFENEQNLVTLEGVTNEILIGIDGFDKNNNLLLVFKNTLHLAEGIDYSISDDSTKIININSDWEWKAGDNFVFIILRVVPNIDIPAGSINGGSIANGSITVDKLGEDVQEAIRNAAASGGSGSSKLVKLENNTVLENDSNEVEIGISNFNKANDTILVFKNALHLIEDVDFSINDDGSKIINIDPNIWEWDAGDEFSFTIFKNVSEVNGDLIQIEYINASLVKYENVVTVNSAVSEVEIGISGYNKNSDIMMVFKNSVHIAENVEYTISDDSSKIVKMNGNWNEDGESGFGFVFIVFKNVVGADDLEGIDLSEYQKASDDSLVTEDKTIVGAINELFQNANNGKEIIADAIGGELSSSDTFAAMGEKIDGITTELRDYITDNGVSVGDAEDLYDMIEILYGINLAGVNLKNAKIRCGGYFTFLILNDGNVWACGNNEYGQLGLGDINARYKFSKIPVEDVKEISCGAAYTFMLKNDGTVWSCGFNGNGELALGDNTHRNTFTQVTTNISDVKEILCGDNNTFMLKNDGTVWSCGYNAQGQLGLNDYTNRNTFTQVTENVSDVKEILCGCMHVIMVKNDGSVWACGFNQYGQLGLGDSSNRPAFTQVTTNVSDVKEIICGGYHTFMIKNDGTVWACGYNYGGQLGLGSTTDKTSFTQVTTNVSGVKEIICGNSHTFMVKNDGTVWSCGNNGYGQLGLGINTNQTTFTQVTKNVSNVKEIICGGLHVFMVKNDGTAWSCGENSSGQLGLEDDIARNIFTQLTFDVHTEEKNEGVNDIKESLANILRSKYVYFDEANCTVDEMLELLNKVGDAKGMVAGNTYTLLSWDQFSNSTSNNSVDKAYVYNIDLSTLPKYYTVDDETYYIKSFNIKVVVRYPYEVGGMNAYIAVYSGDTMLYDFTKTTISSAGMSTTKYFAINMSDIKDNSIITLKCYSNQNGGSSFNYTPSICIKLES